MDVEVISKTLYSAVHISAMNTCHHSLQCRVISYIICMVTFEGENVVTVLIIYLFDANGR